MQITIINNRPGKLEDAGVVFNPGANPVAMPKWRALRRNAHSATNSWVGLGWLTEGAQDANSEAEARAQRQKRFAQLDDAALAQRVETAQQEHEQLQSAANDAEQRAGELDAAFRSNPTAETHNACAVQAQQAANVREAEIASADELAELQAEQKHRAALARIAELTPKANREALVARMHARARGELTLFVARAEVWVGENQDDVAAQNAAAKELNELYDAIGAEPDNAYAPISSEHAFGEVGELLKAEPVGQATALAGGPFGVQVTVAPAASRIDQLTTAIRWNRPTK